MSIFVVLIIEAMLPATVVLGIAWVVSGVVAKRPAHRERPVRRLAWVSPILAFVGGLAIGGRWWLRSYGVR